MSGEKTRKERKILSLFKRINVIKLNEAGLSQRQLAAKFSCGKTQISSILKNKEAILKEWETNKGRAIKRKRKEQYENINKRVWEWFLKAKENNLPVNGTFLQEKALEIAESLNNNTFTASNGWLDSFRRRHNIVFRKINGERIMVSDDSRIVDDWEEIIPSLTEGYSVENIYHISETCLLFKALPDKDLAEGEKDYTSYRISSERITVALCCNAHGIKEKPLIVTLSKNPRCLKGIDMSSLGVFHRADKKVWVTSDILQEWLDYLNEEMKSKNRKILLLLDNALCSPNNLNLSNIKVEILPRSMETDLQPLDHEVRQAFKILYRKKVLQRLVAQIEETGEFFSICKSISTLDAINFIKCAWTEVRVETIKKCFKAWGIDNQYVHVESCSSPDKDIKELEKLCKAANIRECLYDEDMYKYEGFLDDDDKNKGDNQNEKSALDCCEVEIKEEPLIAEGISVEKGEEDKSEKYDCRGITPFSTIEALSAIRKLKETFKSLDVPNSIEKLDFLENQLKACISVRNLNP